VRLWIDECLSPTLVAAARGRYETTCNEYRGLLHAKDPALYPVISAEEWVLVTNNEADFRALTQRGGLHSGLILLPQRTRADQTLMLEAVLDYIDLRCGEAAMPPAAWMTNRVVEYHDEDDTITAAEWPPSEP
jgi:predicted nuclease of predicted toxin-antitoxin system